MKKCSGCNEKKDESKFYKHKQTKDGLHGKCKECMQKDQREYRKKNRSQINYKRRKRYLENKFKISIYNNEYRNKHPERVNCYRIFHRALKEGSIIRPEECSNCNKKREVIGHHNDYHKPLEVEWLCRKCHQEIHERGSKCLQ